MTQLSNYNSARQQETAIITTANSLPGFILIVKLPIVQLNHTRLPSSMSLFDSVWDCDKRFRGACQNSTVSKPKQAS